MSIDRDLMGRLEFIRDYECKVDAEVNAINEAIEELTVKPERRGRWIHPYEYGLALPEHKCSVCGTWEYADSESNYCPNCGARMDGEGE